MKAVWLDGVGGPEALRYGDRPDPVPGPGEAVVRVKACSLNHLDLWVRRGKSFPRPIIPGSDVVGVVERVAAGVTSVTEGDEVVAYPGVAARPSSEKFRDYWPVCDDFRIMGAHRDGGCAERVAVPAECLLPKPRALTWQDAACLPIAFLTAWHMLFSRAALRPGETVLVQSAGSGVGHAAVQMARHAGAFVITTTGSASKADRAKSLGANVVVNYAAEDVVARIRKVTKGRGCDVVVDHNGARTWDASSQCLARGGRMVVCGVTEGASVMLDLGRFFFAAQSLLGSTLGTRSELMDVMFLTAQGTIRPIVERIYPLSDIQAAHAHLVQPLRFGKIVMVPP